MRIQKTLLTLSLLGLLAACDSDNNNAPAKTFDQTDRMGRPAIGTVFIHQDGNPVVSDPADGPKDRFNRDEPSNDVSMWTGNFVSSLTVFRSLYGNDASDANTFAGILLPDVIKVDLGASGEPAFLGLELQVADSTGGRPLAADVIDAALSVVVFPGAPAPFTSDKVDTNDVAFLASFPYLAAPN